MNYLQQIFEKAVRDFVQPASIVGWVIAKKLRKRGVKLSEAERKKVGRLVYKNVLANRSKFNWGIKRRGVPVSLTLNESDFAFIRMSFDKILDNIVGPLSKDIAKQTYATVRRGAATSIAKDQFLIDEFTRRLYSRWRKALDSLHLFIAASREVGATAHARLIRLELADKRYLVASLSRLHARACQVAGEIDTLLRAGYADGAHARWRTLHEISVVAWLLKKHGDDLAERYWEHVHVESLQAAHQLNRHATLLGERRVSRKELARMQAEVDRLCQRFGESYRNKHGWACPLFKSNNNPNFSQLEELAEFGHFRPYYKMASHNIHAESKGATFRLGVLPSKEGKIILAGPSNVGLDQVGGWTAYSLLNTTTSLTSIESTLDSIVYSQTLMLLKEDVDRNFWAAGAKLDVDDGKLNKRKSSKRKQ